MNRVKVAQYSMDGLMKLLPYYKGEERYFIELLIEKKRREYAKYN